jgi:transcriptional regulator with XRE-family HTH domain
MTPGEIIRASRIEAGLTQTELAARMGTNQAAVARLERHGSNPTVATLDRALRATGHRLEIGARRNPIPDVDEDQIRRHLRMSPAERLAAHQVAYRSVASIRGAAR